MVLLQYVQQYGKNKKVTLKCYNTQDITEFFNEDNEYSMLYRIDNLYGLSQNPDTKDYIMFLEDEYCENCGKQCTHIVEKWCELCEISYLKKNFTNWTSGNEKINNFIQEFQLRINNYTDIIVEWIPYNQFDNIKEIGKNDLFTIYSAIWKNGQLNYDKNKRIYKRNLKNQNEIVTLKSFNSQNITEEFFNEGNKYSIYSHQDDKIYGVSQNPNTKNYIIVIQERYCENCGNEYTDTFHKWCKSCQISNLKKNFTNWTSKNEKIDKFIQEMQLKIDCYDDTIVEWIPYEQFNNIKKINKDDFVTICSAIWKNGQLNYDEYKKIYQRNLKNNDRKIILKFHKLQDHNTDEFFNEANEYSIKIYGDNNRDNKIYGITQNPDTNEYIMVIENKYCEKCSENLHYYTWCKTCQLDNLKNNFINWTSGNKKIDELIQEMQLKINDKLDTIFEWIPFNQFNKIEIIGKGGFAIVYSAIWKDGPLFYKEKFRRTSGNRKVALKCLHNSSQNITDEFINESIFS
uniref:Protein kinase domain-containing protein n=1 Tax=Rhizophagus irregularis (strain DAOM 181602 / DAOM 197198 / MUCL 43194) TaxID=747089 RepID=U9TPL8_RHIID